MQTNHSNRTHSFPCVVFQSFSVFSVFSVFFFSFPFLESSTPPPPAPISAWARRETSQKTYKKSTNRLQVEWGEYGGSTESWSNYKTGSGCSCSRSSRVSLCARERETGRLVGLERESCYGLVGNSRNENSARLIIFTYCKTPSRLYRIERALITFRLCF